MKKVVIFGSGSSAKEFIASTGDKVQIVLVLDNDKGKQGGCFCGHKISAPEDLSWIKYDLIVICSMYWKQIRKQLLDLGVSGAKIKFKKDSFSELKPDLFVRSRESSGGLFATDTHEFRVCNNSGLIFHLPATTVEELVQHYTGYGLYGKESYRAKQLKDSKAENAVLAATLRRYTGVLRPSLLEVGCANGVLLQHFREEGYEVFGQDVDPVSAQLAMRYIGQKNIFVGQLGESNFLTKSFDVVICNQVLEHVPDPLNLLKQIYECIKTDGIIYCSTPNFGGISFKILRENWKNTLAGDHISMFTEETLKTFVNEAGFHIHDLSSCGILLNQQRRKGFELTVDLGLVRTLLDQMERHRKFSLLSLGDDLICIARKF